MPTKIGDVVLLIQAETPGQTKPPGVMNTPQYWPKMTAKIDQVESKNGKKSKLKNDKANELDDDTGKDKSGKTFKIMDTKMKTWWFSSPLRKNLPTGILELSPVLTDMVKKLT